jgi:hypothetical protein
MFAVVMEHALLPITAHAILDIMVNNVNHTIVHKFDSIHQQFVHQTVHV